MLIIAGGYEGGIVGLELPSASETSTSQAPGDESLAFRFICSQGSIRCLSLGSDYLCCGGTDETVQIYGLKNRKKHGDLLLSDGCITALGSSGSISKGLILVGNEYGGLQVYDTRRLQLLKQLKGDKTAITSLSVHPNAELALSVSEAATVRLWDLKSFLCVFYSKINEPCIKVEWNRSGDKYFILSETQLLQLYLSEESKPLLYKAASGIKHTCATWVGGTVAAGCRSGDVVLYSDKTGKGHLVKQLHGKRIKSIASFKDCLITGDGEGLIICSSVVSDQDGSLTLRKRWEYNVDMRINSVICHDVE